MSLELELPPPGALGDTDHFDPTDRRWYVLGAKACADIPASPSGTAYDPWQIAGETADPPDGTNDELAGDYANIADPLATQPGHVWPFMGLGATTRSINQSAPSTISPGGYYPHNGNKEGINHYRRGVRFAPRMLGASGRRFFLWMPLRVLATNARDCLDVLLHHNLVTTVNPGTGANTTALTAGQYTGFRWVLGNLGAAEVSGELLIQCHPMGPFQQTWSARLTVAAQANPESTAPAIDAARGPRLLDLTGAGINMDVAGSQLAILFAARGNTATSYDSIGAGTDGSAAQDGSEVYVKMGAALALLSPGH